VRKERGIENEMSCAMVAASLPHASCCKLGGNSHSVAAMTTTQPLSPISQFPQQKETEKGKLQFS